VVVVGDLGGVGGGDNGRDESGASRQAAELQMMDSDGEGAAGGAPAATNVAEEYGGDAADRASPDALAAPRENSDSCPPEEETSGGAPANAGGAGGSFAGPTLPLSPTSQIAPSGPSGGDVPACAPSVADIVPDAESPASAEPLREGEVATPAEAASQDDGSVSTLTIIEIVLAGALVALVGGIAVEYMLRRRAL
jgi:hypothetical protein